MSDLKEAGRPYAAASDPRAKLFTHGGSQAVRLPKAFRFEGSEVCIRKEGDAVIWTCEVQAPSDQRGDGRVLARA